MCTREAWDMLKPERRDEPCGNRERVASGRRFEAHWPFAFVGASVSREVESHAVCSIKAMARENEH